MTDEPDGGRWEGDFYTVPLSRTQLILRIGAVALFVILAFALIAWVYR